jgi:hypothetical protein
MSNAYYFTIKFFNINYIIIYFISLLIIMIVLVYYIPVTKSLNSSNPYIKSTIIFSYSLSSVSSSYIFL